MALRYSRPRFRLRLQRRQNGGIIGQSYCSRRKKYDFARLKAAWPIETADADAHNAGVAVGRKRKGRARSDGEDLRDERLRAKRDIDALGALMKARRLVDVDEMGRMVLNFTEEFATKLRQIPATRAVALAERLRVSPAEVESALKDVVEDLIAEVGGIQLEPPREEA